jgi:drug/metabolite transporter (DMT)-like permease
VAGSKTPGTAQTLAPAAANAPSLFRIYTLVGIMTIVWSLQFIVAKQALREIPPLPLSGLRTSIAALCMLPVYLLGPRGGSRVRLSAKDLPVLILVATTGITINQIFYALALKNTSVGHSSLIMAVTPLVVLLIAVITRQEFATGPKIVGMIVAFAGVAWLQLSHSQGGAASPLGDVSALICSSSFALSTVIGKNVMDRYGAVAINAFSNVLGAFCLVPFVFLSGLQFSAISVGAWWGVAYMRIAGGAAGYLIYFWALGYLPSSRLSMYAYVQPLLATLAAFVLLDETITVTMLAAGALVLAGVWISGRRA